MSHGGICNNQTRRSNTFEGMLLKTNCFDVIAVLLKANKYMCLPMTYKNGERLTLSTLKGMMVVCSRCSRPLQVLENKDLVPKSLRHPGMPDLNGHLPWIGDATLFFKEMGRHIEGRMPVIC